MSRYARGKTRLDALKELDDDGCIFLAMFAGGLSDSVNGP